jgi:hypothetical protein
MKLSFLINHPSLVHKYHVKIALVLSMEYLQSIVRLGNRAFRCWSYFDPVPIASLVSAGRSRPFPA